MDLQPDTTDHDRYKRLRELGWDMALLRRSKAMVVGVGALGNEIVKNLALAGVGNLLIVDPDSIETHNLTRSVLFRSADVGRKKAEVAARAARQIEPRLNARWFASTVQRALGLGVFREVDAVLGGVDNVQTRRDLNLSCMRTGTPFIDGGLFYLDGDVRIFGDPFPVCFDCTLSHEEREDGQRRWSCLGMAASDGPTGGPTSPTTASMVGALQAQFALKHMHRHQRAPIRSVLANAVRIRFNGFADEYESWNLSRDPDCPSHLAAQRIPGSRLLDTGLGVGATAGELLGLAQRQFGPGSYVDLGFDLVYEMRCPACGSTEPALLRRGSFPVSVLMCPRCTASSCRTCGHSLVESAAERPDLVFPDHLDCASCFQSSALLLRDTRCLNRIEPESPALEHSLSALSVPLMDILEVKGVEGDEPAYLLLDGDRERVFEPVKSCAGDSDSRT